MISHACSLIQLRERIDAFIAILGPDALVGTAERVTAGVESIDCLITLDWVMVNPDHRVVGDEANDYKKKPGDRDAVRIN